MKPSEEEFVTIEPITAHEVAQWGGGLLLQHVFTWFAQVLNGEYSVEDARADCLSVVRLGPASQPTDGEEAGQS